jgi:hypothetical protein
MPTNFKIVTVNVKVWLVKIVVAPAQLNYAFKDRFAYVVFFSTYWEKGVSKSAFLQLVDPCDDSAQVAQFIGRIIVAVVLNCGWVTKPPTRFSSVDHNTHTRTSISIYQHDSGYTQSTVWSCLSTSIMRPVSSNKRDWEYMD